MGENLEVHKFYPHKLNIGPCNSCFSCWDRKRLGECSKHDDFAQILDIYKRADYVLLAAPLYYFDFPATVKNVIDRFFITLEPALIAGPDGATTHPKRFARPRKAVLISSCGFPEIENFDLLRRHFRIICEHMEWRHAGELLVSASGMAHAPRMFDRKYELLRQAGAELARDAILPATTEAVAAPVLSAEDYRRVSNLSYEGGTINQAKVVAIVMKAMLGGPPKEDK
jgi:hypothetical protein